MQESSRVGYLGYLNNVIIPEYIARKLKALGAGCGLRGVCNHVKGKLLFKTEVYSYNIVHAPMHNTSALPVSPPIHALYMYIALNKAYLLSFSVMNLTALHKINVFC